MSQSEKARLERAIKALTRDFAYASEFSRLTWQIVNSSSKLIALMNENANSDPEFSKIVAVAHDATVAKRVLADAWLADARVKLDRMTKELAYWEENHGKE